MDYIMTKTRAGLTLDQKLPNGGFDLKLVRAKAGAAAVPVSELKELTAVVQETQELELKPLIRTEGATTITVPVTLSNAGLAEGYVLYQVGIYAEDPDLGEILYQVAQVTRDGGEVIPSEANAPGFAIDWELYINVENSENVSVTVSEAGRLTVRQGDARYIAVSEKGTAGGVAELGDNGKVLSAQLPSYVDDVLEYDMKDEFPAQGESGKIYVDTSTNLTYRWSGSGYVEISQSLALGETASTAFRGDKGKEAYDNAKEALKLLGSIAEESNLGMLNSGNQYVLQLKGTNKTIDMSRFSAFKLKLAGGYMVDFNNVVKTKGKITATCAVTDLEITYNSNTATIVYKNYDPELLNSVTLFGYDYNIIDEETTRMAQELGFLLYEGEGEITIPGI